MPVSNMPQEFVDTIYSMYFNSVEVCFVYHIRSSHAIQVEVTVFLDFEGRETSTEIIGENAIHDGS